MLANVPKTGVKKPRAPTPYDWFHTAETRREAITRSERLMMCLMYRQGITTDHNLEPQRYVATSAAKFPAEISAYRYEFMDTTATTFK